MTDTPPAVQDLQAALSVLWPDRPKVLFRPVEGSSDPVLTEEEVGMLTRVAQALSDLSADAEDAWRHAKEAEHELETARQQLLSTASIASAAVDTGTLSAGVRGALHMLHNEASAAVSRGLTQAYAVGLAEGEARAKVTGADIQALAVEQMGREAEDERREAEEKA